MSGARSLLCVSRWLAWFLQVSDQTSEESAAQKIAEPSLGMIDIDIEDIQGEKVYEQK
jgi:hypothetical protein